MSKVQKKATKPPDKELRKTKVILVAYGGLAANSQLVVQYLVTWWPYLNHHFGKILYLAYIL